MPARTCLPSPTGSAPRAISTRIGPVPRPWPGARARARSRLAGCRAGPYDPWSRRSRVSGAGRGDVRGLDRAASSQTGRSSGASWFGEAAALAGVAFGVAWAGSAPTARARRSRGSSWSWRSSRRRAACETSSPRSSAIRSSSSPTRSSTRPGWSTPTGRASSSRSRPGGRRSCGTATPSRVLGHAPGLLDDEQLVAEVAAAARLALENERLQAEVRARLEELRASRARIVAAGDAERRRLERDLHDGAQQRLVALSLSLRLLRSQPRPRRSARLDAAAEELALGASPSCASSRTASSRRCSPTRASRPQSRRSPRTAPVPIAVARLPEERFAARVETAAYTLVAETARAATARVSRSRGRARRRRSSSSVETRRASTASTSSRSRIASARSTGGSRSSATADAS